jgi:uncharacterized membrane protein YgdD (TMEM256/DUF423 family)
MPVEPARGFARALGASGALACSLAVALGAYAEHAAIAQSQHRLGVAAVFLFGHGLALLVLAPRARSRLQRIGLAMLLLGMLLFSGSLALAGLLGTSTAFAPFGGVLLILGWLVYAVAELVG